jgi:hypothetical protein
MKLETEVFTCLCAMKVFKINGVDADNDDFGNKEDVSRETAEDYAGCDMRFTMKDATDEVLNKYGITKSEYETVGEKLEELLSFGCCGYCV